VAQWWGLLLRSSISSRALPINNVGRVVYTLPPNSVILRRQQQFMKEIYHPQCWT